MSDQDSFRQWLKRARQALDMTQEALAEQVGYATPTLQKIEQGARRPSRELAELLVNTLQIPSEDRAAFLQLARVSVEPRTENREPRTENQEPRTENQTVRSRSVIPVSATALIGRQAERAAIGRCLDDPACRLLTLVGPGGIGKTRLAMQVAADAAGRFADGAAWVNLVPVVDCAQVAITIADAVGCALVGSDAEAQLLAFVRDRRLLIVLDNLEHLLDATPIVAELLRQAPRVRLLVTSRERLQIGGEWVIDVAGLGLPIAAIDAARSDAVLLFLERARQALHTFTLQPRNSADIARICRMLNGMPLAIEIVAPWVRLLSVAEIADELTRGIDVLQTSARDLPARHRSIRAVFDHSWALLAPPEQEAMRKLSVFRGGFTRAAATQIADAPLPMLAALTDKSLLRRSGAGDTTRYDFHPLVQQYAAAKLQEAAQEQSATSDHHCHYYAAVLRERLVLFHEAAAGVAYAHMLPDMDNIRQAWTWGVAHGNYAALDNMVLSVQTIYEDRGWFREGLAVFGQAAATLRGVSPSDPAAFQQTLGQLLGRQGYFMARSGSFEAAQPLLDESLRLLRPGSDSLALTDTLMNLGMVTFQRGRYAAAQDWLAESIQMADRLGEQFFTDLSRCFVGLTALAQGRYADARAAFTGAVASFRNNGSPRGLTIGLGYGARVALEEGQIETAHTMAREALQVSSLSHDRWGVGTALAALGRVALGQRDGDEALYLSREAAEIFEALDERWSLGDALIIQGHATLALDDQAAAERLFMRAAQIGQACGLPPMILDALLGYTMVLIQRQQWTAALPILRQISDHPATIHATRACTAALSAQASAQLAPEQISEVGQQGYTELLAYLQKSSYW